MTEKARDPMASIADFSRSHDEDFDRGLAARPRAPYVLVCTSASMHMQVGSMRICAYMQAAPCVDVYARVVAAISILDLASHNMSSCIERARARVAEVGCTVASINRLQAQVVVHDFCPEDLFYIFSVWFL